MPGFDFVGLQVRDIDRAADFYERTIGLARLEDREGAVVFKTDPIPFGQHFAIRDLDGYIVTIHDAQHS